MRSGSAISASPRTVAGTTLTGFGEPRKLVSSIVRPSFFDLLGREPVLGRTFSGEELVSASSEIRRNPVVAASPAIRDAIVGIGR